MLNQYLVFLGFPEALPRNYVLWSYLNTDMCKFKPSHKDETRALSADSSKIESSRLDLQAYSF